VPALGFFIPRFFLKRMIKDRQQRTLDGAELPKAFCAYTPCFRREAGSAGKDTRDWIQLGPLKIE